MRGIVSPGASLRPNVARTAEYRPDAAPSTAGPPMISLTEVQALSRSTSLSQQPSPAALLAAGNSSELGDRFMMVHPAGPVTEAWEQKPQGRPQQLGARVELELTQCEAGPVTEAYEHKSGAQSMRPASFNRGPSSFAVADDAGRSGPASAQQPSVGSASVGGGPRRRHSVASPTPKGPDTGSPFSGQPLHSSDAEGLRFTSQGPVMSRSRSNSFYGGNMAALAASASRAFASRGSVAGMGSGDAAAQSGRFDRTRSHGQGASAPAGGDAPGPVYVYDAKGQPMLLSLKVRA